MNQEANPGRRRTNLVLLFFFLAGMIGGISITLGIGIFGSVHSAVLKYTATQLGKFLDTDFVYLSTGAVLKGRIITEDAKSVWIELNNNSVRVDQKDVLAIEQKFYTRYVKASW